MKVGELKKILELYNDDVEIEATGCYGSSGYIDKIFINNERKILIFETDIFTG